MTRALSQMGWHYRQNGSWLPYQKAIRAGYLEYKEAHCTDQQTGMPCIRVYAHILPKGMAKLAEHFSRTDAM